MTEAVAPRPSFFTAFGLWLKRVVGGAPPAPPPGIAATPVVVNIVVAPLDKDPELAASQKVFEALDARDGVAVRVVKTAVPVEDPRQAPQIASAALKARHQLAEEDHADLLIWGEATPNGPMLRFATVAQSEDDQPGGFGTQMRFSAPDLAGPATHLLYGLTLIALPAATEALRQAQRDYLPGALKAAAPLLARIPPAWSMEQQMLVLFANAQIMAALALLDGGEWFDKAIEGYQAALKRLPRNHDPLDEAMIRRQIGNLLLAQADKADDPVPLLQSAAEQFRALVELMPRQTFPLDWGTAQNRLGLCLYRIDLQTGQTEVLKEALTAFQGALSVFPRTDSRFADTLNNLAQGLQVYGDQMKSPDVLFRAIETCRQALEVRVREKSPTGWAATLNTLGTALFLHDRHKESSENLDEAASVLKEAADLYQSLGLARQAQVALKNLSHVERLAKQRQQRKVADPGWWETGDEDEKPAAAEKPPAEKRKAT